MKLCEVCRLPAEHEVVDREEEATLHTDGTYSRQWRLQQHYFCRVHVRSAMDLPLPMKPGPRQPERIESGT